MQRVEQVLYGYTYDRANDLYVVRGIESYEMSFEPRYMEYIPGELVEQIRTEYSTINGVMLDDITPTESFSESRSYAVIDFHGREYGQEEIQSILRGQIVEKEPIINFVRKPVSQRVMNRFKPIRFGKKQNQLDN